MAIVNRRRNYRLFEYLVSVMSDAELRTMRECVSAEWSFRVSRSASARHMAAEPVEELGEETDELGPDDMTQAESPAALKVARRRVVSEPPPAHGPATPPPQPVAHPHTGQQLIRRPSGTRRAQSS